MKDQISVSLVQFACSDDKAESVARLLALTETAASQSDLVLLAGTAFISYTTCSSFHAKAESVPGPFTEALSEIARQHKAHICAGVVEADGDEIYNSAVLIDADGQILANHRKVALGPADIDGGFCSGTGPTVVQTDLGRIGILICFDSQDQNLIHSLFNQKPEIVLVPSYGIAKTNYLFTEKINCMLDEAFEEWQVRMRMLARFCRAYVLRADHVGVEQPNQVRIGHSIAVSPGGHVLCEGTMKPETIHVTLKPGATEQRLWRSPHIQRAEQCSDPRKGRPVV